MARDSFNREIDYLRVSVTDRCNLSCIYCRPKDHGRCFSPGDILTAEEIKRLAQAAKRFGVRKVRLTGGEPLVREDILSIVTSIKEAGVRDLSLTTNGLLLADMADNLKRAGLDRINISLDTMKPDRYREITDGGSLEKVLDGIEAAEAMGLLPVKINMVPIRGVNDDEIIDFARLTLQKPYHIRFIEFMPSGREKFWNSERCINASEVKEKVSGLGPLEKLRFRGKGPSRNYRIKGARGILGLISPLSHAFCYCCNRLRINAVGKIRPCLFSQTEIDIKTPMRNGADDGEIERLLALAVEVKPEGNYLRKPSDVSLGSMSSIGG